MNPVRDPAAQPERTWLAWRRTTLAGAVLVALGVRHAIVGDGGVLGVVTIAAVCGAWVLSLTVAHLRMRQLQSPGPRAADPTLCLVTAASVVLMAVTALCMLLVARR